MTPSHLKRFLVKVQRQKKAIEEDAQAIIDSFKNFHRRGVGLNLETFFKYLFSDDNPPLLPSHGVVKVVDFGVVRAQTQSGVMTQLKLEHTERNPQSFFHILSDVHSQFPRAQKRRAYLLAAYYYKFRNDVANYQTSTGIMLVTKGNMKGWGRWHRGPWCVVDEVVTASSWHGWRINNGSNSQPM
ncbi:hypothetical protein JHK82_036846 [Glycine max]|nr:hypothetical protein JHK85_037600 [Glycine max]KAG4977579.1 hypothetical protein JHK86_037053 [Glycine max]KAG5113577.1 hypothetical protein JHK82_036846 [Glycine max]KAG5130856.1 hypothetical protein JHK84_037253 [Glycine max]